MLALITCTLKIGHAQQPPPPCNPNPLADQDMATVRQPISLRTSVSTSSGSRLS
jgi:hypothetical protein